jgi:hypothetical protein
MAPSQRADFTFDPQANQYTCPDGKRLVLFRRSYKTPRTGITSAGTRLYRASQHDCKACPLKPRCCPNMTFRKIPRDLNHDARDVAKPLPRRRNMNGPAIAGRRSRCCRPT